MDRAITVYNLGGLPTAEVEEFHELQEDFKIHDEDKLMKLALLIVTRGFKYAFKAWKDPEGKLWIIDAHQRKKALMHLKRRGMTIPPIPYEPIHAEDKREAVEEIAAYNSEFAKKNPDTILFEKYQISTDNLEQFSLQMGTDIEKMDLGINTKLSLTEELDTIDLDAEYEDLDKEVVSLSQAGDIWQLGRHRLMCGDSCSSQDVATLMDNRKAHAVITDPPYNVDYQGKSDEQASNTIENDSMSDSSFDKFLFRAFRNAFMILREGGPIYVFHSDSEGYAFRRNFHKAGFKLAQCCVWIKNSIVMGRQDYQWQHEPVLYGWKPGAGHPWYADRTQSTVWNFDRPTKSDLHPTMKPIQLISYPLLNSTKEGELVVDLFNGSGSTIMSCEQHGRICYAMEIMPSFVDVSIARYIRAVGDQEVYCLRNGKRYHYKELSDDNR